MRVQNGIHLRIVLLGGVEVIKISPMGVEAGIMLTH
jgi:S-ribosylhomocysteine lyase LuxS involved in autoinducer biosynthesis